MEEMARVEITLSESELNERLADIESDLERYTCEADRADYAIAVFSGLVSAALDSLIVGETDMGDELKISHKKVNQFIQSYARKKDQSYAGKKDIPLKDAIAYLERTYKVAQDDVWKGKDISVSARNHHLADLAHHPTPVGLLASLVVQFLKAGLFVSKDGSWHLLKVETSTKDLAKTYVPVVITALLNWIVNLSKKAYEEEYAKQMPKAVLYLARLVASTPVIVEVARCADNWFGHLVSDMGGSKNTAGGGMGIPGIFLSLLHEVSSLPGLKDTGLPQVVNDLYSKRKIDMRHEAAFLGTAGRQAIPVLFNEVYVRLCFFIGRLAYEYRCNGGFDGIDWKRVIPFGNRTVDRMMTVSTMTFSTADIADAAARAAMESGANWVLFSGKMATRVNYVGAGRTVISIVKEIGSESKETKLLHEKMLLTEAKAGIFVKQVIEFRDELGCKVSEYVLADLEAFTNGFSDMDVGIAGGKADLVIRGSATIQSALGREAQFTTKEEFDNLMGSDDYLVL